MTTMHHFGFIGFGLIGGSVAHALREQYPDSELMAYNYYCLLYTSDAADD